METELFSSQCFQKAANFVAFIREQYVELLPKKAEINYFHSYQNENLQ